MRTCETDNGASGQIGTTLNQPVGEIVAAARSPALLRPCLGSSSNDWISEFQWPYWNMTLHSRTPTTNKAAYSREHLGLARLVPYVPARPCRFGLR